jgi:hypothetical protein
MIWLLKILFYQCIGLKKYFVLTFKLFDILGWWVGDNVLGYVRAVIVELDEEVAGDVDVALHEKGEDRCYPSNFTIEFFNYLPS